MVDESVNIAEQFPVPARGVPILCSLNFDADFPVPLIYFGRETRSAGRDIPESPEPAPVHESSRGRVSNNPLNSIIRKWETHFAIQGGVMESSDFVATKGRTDDRYYHADEWLDDAEEDEADSGEYIGEVYLDAFRVIVPGQMDDEEEDLEDEDESDGTDQENEEGMEDVGGNWQLLLKRLDSTKQQVIKELVIDLETFQAFPGHTKQKKQKHLRDTIARLRRLLPKINHVQSQWQAAVWNVVVATNEAMNMQAFMELWNDVAPSKQKEDIIKERDELVSKLAESIAEVAAVWKRGESLMRNKHEATFNLLTRVWDLWLQEDECAGRLTPSVVAARPVSKTEKRFAASLCELVPQLTTDIVPVLLRVALFGTKKSAAASSKKTLPEGSEEDQPGPSSTTPPPESTADALPCPSLPISVCIYRKNELLKCKLIEIKSLSQQTIQIVDKEWENYDASNPPEFSSFEALFESYQQKYVRKQDRLVLPSVLDAWKYFAYRSPGSQEYVTLYDLAVKAASVVSFAFTDKAGVPVFLPSIAAARAADAEKRKKQNDLKEERKRKREALEAKAREQSMKNPPFNEQFVPFPEFNKDLFAAETGGHEAPVIASQ